MNIFTWFLLFSIVIPNYLSAEEIEDTEEVSTEIVNEMDPELILADGIKPPMIVFHKGDGHELVLSGEMESVLTAYNATFKAWKTADYAKTITEGLSFDSEKLAPFAFVLDINKDDKNDVVIDGFNGKNPEIVAILSDGDKYKVVHVASLHKQSDPKTVKSVNDGEVEIGLNYLLWPNKSYETKNVTVNVFSVITPQETDVKGELLSDGGLVEFSFTEGKFIPSYPKF